MHGLGVLLMLLHKLAFSQCQQLLEFLRGVLGCLLPLKHLQAQLGRQLLVPRQQVQHLEVCLVQLLRGQLQPLLQGGLL
uniref:Putative secreted protein n=1 Tax=Ixodes ricinus TaxID=34613 RepID=A0A6B0U6Q3_IXORI